MTFLGGVAFPDINEQRRQRRASDLFLGCEPSEGRHDDSK